MPKDKTTAPGTPPAPQDAVVAYIGPTIYGVVRQGTVLKGGVPAELEEHMKQVKPLRALLVPVDRFAQAWAGVNTPGSAEHSLCLSVAQALYPELMETEVDGDG